MRTVIWASLTVLLASARPAVPEPATCRSACRRCERSGRQPDRRTTSHQVVGLMDAFEARCRTHRPTVGDDFVAILWDGKKHTKADYLDELRPQVTSSPSP